MLFLLWLFKLFLFIKFNNYLNKLKKIVNNLVKIGVIMKKEKHISRNEQYNVYVESKIPKTKSFPTLIYAFIVGGIICMIGQFLLDILMVIWPQMGMEEASAWMLVMLIFISSFLTAIGVYDRIGVFAGAGSIVPITGFSNSITSPAVEFKKEGIIFGLCVKMFTVAGPVIVTGLVISFLTGLIYLIF